MLYGFLPGVGFQEIAVLLLLGVLLFGRKLPDLGRSIGKTVVEFKKGVSGLEDEISGNGSSASKSAIEPEPVRPPQRVTPSTPKFDDLETRATSDLPPTV